MLAAQPQVVAHRGFHAAEGSWGKYRIEPAQRPEAGSLRRGVRRQHDGRRLADRLSRAEDSRHETSCAEEPLRRNPRSEVAGRPRNPHPPGVLRTGTERPVDQTDPRNQETRDAATRDAGRGGDPPSGARNAARAADRIHLVQPARLRRSAPPATRRRRRLRQQRHGGYESRRSEKSGDTEVSPTSSTS